MSRRDWDNYIDTYEDYICQECNQSPCDCDIDVCQHCGGYFTWTKHLRETWERVWKPGPNDRQPQRCHRCLVDDTWLERSE